MIHRNDEETGKKDYVYCAWGERERERASIFSVISILLFSKGLPYFSFIQVYFMLILVAFQILQIHPEAGKGQFEIALGYTTCTKAADNLVFTREVVRAVARKHGLLATFMPK